ncbi:MAG: ribose 5-phosphate isomerase B [bacterium]|nr:ribose 5-phosphate isomerase B [bacterium]
MAGEIEIRELVRRAVGEAVAADTDQTARSAPPKSIAIGADHGGYGLKQKLISHLGDQGFQVVDCGTTGPESVDYPDFAHAVARRVSVGECSLGIIVDGAGIGSSMAANKVPGIRAALCYDISSARNSREHNHANVLTLGAGLVGEDLARQIVDVWIATPWGGGRHARRATMIDEIGRTYTKS